MSISKKYSVGGLSAVPVFFVKKFSTFFDFYKAILKKQK